MASAANALGVTNSITINGGAVNLADFTQTILPLTLAGGAIENGAISLGPGIPLPGISSTGGVVDGITGATSLAITSGVTTLKTTTGRNTYTGATTINGGTLMGGSTNAFSAASPTTVNAGGTLDLGGVSLTQTINSVTLVGGVIQNGQLNGAISGAGTINGIGGSASVDATGFITLEGSNSYTGPTVVDIESMLTAGGPNAFSPNSAMTVDVCRYSRSSRLRSDRQLALGPCGRHSHK